MSQDGAFLFDQRRFWHDARVKKMTAEQVGIYLKMLSIQWEEGNLPVDADDLACEISEGRRFYTADQLSTGKDTLSPLKGELMDGLQECFSRLDDDPSRMRNSYMHEVREEWRRIQKARREGGRRGGKKSRKPKQAKTLEGELKDTFEDTSKDTPKPNVSKGREGKGTKPSEEDIPAEGNGKPDYAEAYARILAAYHRLKPRWYSILKLGTPRLGALTKNDKAAIRKAIKAGHKVEDIEESLAHVENSAYLMGQTERSKDPQLTLSRLLYIREGGEKPIDFVGINLEKSRPDHQMKPLIGMHDNRGRFVREEDLPPLPEDLGEELLF